MLGHSNGNVIIQYLLQVYAPTGWATKYIGRYIAVSGPFLGSPLMLESIASGIPSFGNMSVIPKANFVEVMRSLGSAYGLLPAPNTSTVTFGDGSSYDAADVELYARIGGTSMSNQFEFTGTAREILTKDPGVPVTCLLSDMGASSTAKDLHWPGSATEKPQVVNGHGDGTVPLDSLRVCNSWPSVDSSKTFDGIVHKDTVSHPTSINYISCVVTSSDPAHCS
eukprot:Plantae.Rhodophyta-Rhodochaete_pulchella.ctg59981.p1 GENE.Plantae.Rhodophyta-Rhodochaete_pulchella.ctg59981~~Plantae.Rhodophyta-Rhodochaete_pulchella.ctg59981.p1  ORF type:complete len:253 (-),score=19.71 Plantae.Rhodophyta-Rhodochaete_pulchella.ctg59981:49-717(-)